MNKKTLKALQASIRHWERMANGKRKIMKGSNHKGLEEPDSAHCALCRLFEKDCITLCPIGQSTGRPRCEGTPYRKASMSWDSSCFPEYGNDMIKFLKSLLP